MIDHKKYKRAISRKLWMFMATASSFGLFSCYEFELPEAGSKPDDTPPTAKFGAAQSDTDFLYYTFGNLSDNATDYVWDFGDGNSSTSVDGENTYASEGTYMVTLTASDKLGAVSVSNLEILVEEPPEPPALTPEIENGDFEEGSGPWKVSTFTDGTTNPYNSSSDGSWYNYDGVDTGSKTRGAKWTSSTSSGPHQSADSRFAYQEILVTPDTEYFIEFTYAIKTDKDDIDGGDRVIVELLDGYFADGKDALASSVAGPVTQYVGSVANGKTSFTDVTHKFTSNSTGNLSIWIYAITNDELYVDNVKVYPVE